MKEAVIDWIRHFYYHTSHGVTHFSEEKYQSQAPYWSFVMFCVLVLSSVVIWYISRFLMLRFLHVIVDRSKVTWDDHFLENKVFKSLAFLVPLMFMDYFLSITFYQYPKMEGYFSRIVTVLIILVVMIIINRLMNAFRDIVQEKERYRDKPIQSYFQVVKIISSCILIILMLSVITDRTPVFFLTSLGAMTAIVVLVFRDTILGFVGSVQMSTNDLIRIGDWVTMDKFSADGHVVEINLATVKIQNFDKTITTIPTYFFISDSFKNWRGMQESDGRRIKRAVYIQIDSIHFASPELLEKLKKIRILKDYIEEREAEIRSYNQAAGYEVDEINARRQTNIGLFRKYIEQYLRQNPLINQEMNLMVRHLDPTEKGVPLEIVCFSIPRKGPDYEAVIADIFDHVFAMVGVFELRIFESPTGDDFRRLSGNRG